MEADVRHLHNNTSYHCPIYFTVRAAILRPKPRVEITPKSKSSWKRATEQQRGNFKIRLEENLKILEISHTAESYCDVHCSNVLVQFLVDMLHTIKSTAAECLTYPKQNKGPAKKSTIF